MGFKKKKGAEKRKKYSPFLYSLKKYEYKFYQLTVSIIRDIYGNTIEFSLRLKPYESLFVVLPKLYDEYCQKKEYSTG